MLRRDFLRASAALAVAGFPSSALRAAVTPGQLTFLSAPQFFDFAWLKGQAKQRAAQSYQQVQNHIPDAVKSLNWDQYQAIQYRPDHAVWAEDKLRFQVKFFHLGLFFQTPVQIHILENNQARELAYDPAMFNYGKSGLKDAHMPKDLGFAGFRVNIDKDWERDVIAFLGASYFRAVGAEWQYGLSARGLAIDCGMDRPEEFPIFTDFWLERPAEQSARLIVYALLDSPSVAGAYRFEIEPGATLVMEVDVALYPRKTIERIGIAPLTSMFQYGENDRRLGVSEDWRPEIHDSDGLAMQRGNGEWIWRPLTNPEHLRFNAYQDENPQGFGLLQRDRNFDHYQDDGVFYDRRPSLWVEPKSQWGKGSVQLVEIPTIDETFDNIVGFWNPQDKPQPGREYLYSYRLYWGNKMPFTLPFAQVVATRTGVGGVIGQKRRYYSRRFVIDFAGGKLSTLEKGVEAVISASCGTVEITSARPLAAINGYRAMFDLRPDDTCLEPIDLRVYLKANGQALSETWLYQWTPPALAQRTF